MSENASSGGAILRVEHLGKSFGSHEVLRDIDFSVYKGEVISIIGASGSGKSTLLRCINLLEEPSAGTIYFKGKPVSYAPKDKSALRTEMGMVFQSFNLLNNMTVLKNCMVGVQVVKKQKLANSQRSTCARWACMPIKTPNLLSSPVAKSSVWPSHALSACAPR